MTGSAANRDGVAAPDVHTNDSDRADARKETAMGNEGRFVWYELLTRDTEAAKAFYTEVIGWSTQPFEGSGQPYSMWLAGETPVGGVMRLLPEHEAGGLTPQWWAHVAVDDVDAAARRAEELGATIRTPGTDIPEIGRFAVVDDPQGALIALFTRKGEPMPPPDRMKVGSVGWHELNTTDHESAWKFYSELFGWKHTTSMDMGPEWGTYFMFRNPDDPEDRSAGGMFDAAKQAGMPPKWLYYVNVEAMDPAVGRIEAGGGKLLTGPMDVPGGGRAAQALDPQGVHFAIFSLQ